MRASAPSARRRNTATTRPGTSWSSFCRWWITLSWRLKSTGSAEQLRHGVELIVKQMEEVLRQLQVSPIATVGEEFDPRIHEALGSVERDDLPDQHVAEEIRRGYKLRERLLRPALVRVAHNPKQTSNANELDDLQSSEPKTRDEFSRQT